MHKVLLEGMLFHARHGFFEEENRIGGKFEVNAEITTNFSESMRSDEIDGTIDYSKVHELIADEMKTPSKLLEHLGSRIIDKIYSAFPQAENIKLKISKLNPPISGEIERVSISIEEARV